VNVTDLFWPGLIRSTVFVLTIAPCGFWIVTVTLIPTSCESPPSWIATTNESPVVATTVFVVDSDSVWPPGRVFTSTMFVPWRPVGVPPVDVPRRRVRRSDIDRSLVRSRFATNFESGTVTPLIPSFCSSAVNGPL
jgi:hypothetical protein